MEKYVNEFLAKLYGKIPENDLKVVKEQFVFFLKDYTITEKQTDLAVKYEDLDKELKEYIVSLKIEGLSDKTLKRYYYEIHRFIQAVNKPCKEISTNEIKLYLYNLKQTTNMKDISLNNTRMVINAFYSWLVNNEYMEKNPCKPIKSIKYEKRIRQPLSAIQMEQLREVCETPRDRALIEFLYATGCRVNEHVNAKVSDVDFEHKELKVMGKGKKERTLYLNARSILAINDYLEDRDIESEYLFSGYEEPFYQLSVRWVEKIIKRLGREIGIDISLHYLRHTTATDALRRGMPIEQVQIMLGHEDISTTLVYADVDREEVKLNQQKYIV